MSLSAKFGGNLLGGRRKPCVLCAVQPGQSDHEGAPQYRFEAIATELGQSGELGAGGLRPEADSFIRWRAHWAPDLPVEAIVLGARILVGDRKAWLEITEVFPDTDDGWFKARLSQVG